MFWAHAITVRGDITVEISPFINAFRVNSATVVDGRKRLLLLWLPSTTQRLVSQVSYADQISYADMPQPGPILHGLSGSGTDLDNHP